MIKGSKELTKKVWLSDDTFNSDRDAARKAISKIIADHYEVPLESVEWQDFRKPGWHMDPPGRFFIDGEPLHMYVIGPWDEESEE